MKQGVKRLASKINLPGPLQNITRMRGSVARSGSTSARVAELVDAQVSEACGVTPVGVRLSSRAH
jgi:hypothetical protein